MLYVLLQENPKFLDFDVEGKTVLEMEFRNGHNLLIESACVHSLRCLPVVHLTFHNPYLAFLLCYPFTVSPIIIPPIGTLFSLTLAYLPYPHTYVTYLSLTYHTYPTPTHTPHTHSTSLTPTLHHSHPLHIPHTHSTPTQHPTPTPHLSHNHSTSLAPTPHLSHTHSTPLTPTPHLSHTHSTSLAPTPHPSHPLTVTPFTPT